MDFSLLNPSNLRDFLSLSKTYKIRLDVSLTPEQQAQELFNQLQKIPGLNFPSPVVDLYIAHHYNGPRNMIYTVEQIENLSEPEIRTFDQVFYFGLSADYEFDRTRIFRILKFLNLIESPINLLSQTSILQRFCDRLSIDDLENFRLVLEKPYLDCRVPINDPDKKIKYIQGVNEDHMYLYKDILKDGSILTYTFVNENQAREFESWGFNLSLSEKILYMSEYSEIGDIFESRLQTLIDVIGSGVQLVGPRENLPEHYQDYRSWTPLDFIQHKYSAYEYDKWMGSVEDLAQNNVGQNIFLEIKLRVSPEQTHQVMKDVLPDLNYEIQNNLLIIQLDDIVPFLSW